MYRQLSKGSRYIARTIRVSAIPIISIDVARAHDKCLEHDDIVEIRDADDTLAGPP